MDGLDASCERFEIRLDWVSRSVKWPMSNSKTQRLALVPGSECPPAVLSLSLLAAGSVDVRSTGDPGDTAEFRQSCSSDFCSATHHIKSRAVRIMTCFVVSSQLVRCFMVVFLFSTFKVHVSSIPRDSILPTQPKLTAIALTLR